MTFLDSVLSAMRSNDPALFYSLKRELECEGHEPESIDGWNFCKSCHKDLGVNTDYEDRNNYERSEIQSLNNF